MKITGPTGPSAASAGTRTARAAGGFSLPGGAAPASAAAPTAQAGGVSGVSALMALQGVEDSTERRRRAIRRGGGLLDRLDELKLAMLSGQATPGLIDRLARAAREDRPAEADLDPGLASVLDMIDVRAAVELAKAQVASAA